MSSPSKCKGSSFERVVAKVLTESGIPAKRQVLSGSHPDHKGDVKLDDGTILECKNREDISDRLWMWMDKADFVVIKKNHKQPLVVMPIEKFIDMYKTIQLYKVIS